MLKPKPELSTYIRKARLLVCFTLYVAFEIHLNQNQLDFLKSRSLFSINIHLIDPPALAISITCYVDTVDPADIELDQ